MMTFYKMHLNLSSTFAISHWVFFFCLFLDKICKETIYKQQTELAQNTQKKTFHFCRFQRTSPQSSSESPPQHLRNEFHFYSCLTFLLCSLSFHLSPALTAYFSFYLFIHDTFQLSPPPPLSVCWCRVRLSFASVSISLGGLWSCSLLFSLRWMCEGVFRRGWKSGVWGGVHVWYQRRRVCVGAVTSSPTCLPPSFTLHFLPLLIVPGP